MITKIMKHDFLALRKPLGITIGLTLLTTILAAIAISVLRNTLGYALVFLTFLGLIAAYLVYSIILLVHYYRSMYGKTGYFTMSIPASSTELFWAKSLFNLFALCLCTLVVFCGGFFLFTAMFFEDASGNALTTLFATVQTWQVAFLVLMAMLLSSISSVFIYQFIVTAGNGRPFLDRFGKIGGPILVAVLLYVGTQIIGFLLSLFPWQLIFFAPKAPFISLDWDGFFFNLVGPIDPSESNPVEPPAVPIWWLLGTGVLTAVTGYLTALLIKKETSLR